MIQAHYCSGDLAAINLFEKGSCCCDKPDLPKKNDCCKDEVKSLQIQTAQIKVEQDDSWSHFCKLITPKQQAITYSFAFQKSSTPYHIIHPRPIEIFDDIPLYTRYHSFLFYG